MVFLTWHLWLRKIWRHDLLQKISLCSTRASMIICPLNTSQPSIYRRFWSQQDHCAYFNGLLMATNVKVCEGIHPQLQYVCVYNIMPLTIWFITTTSNFENPLSFFWWTSSQISHVSSSMTPFLFCSIGWQKWNILFQPPRAWQLKVLQNFSSTTYITSTMVYNWTLLDFNSYPHLERSQSIFLWPSSSNRWTSLKEEVLEQSLMYDQLPSKWLGRPITFGRVAYNNTYHSSLGHIPLFAKYGWHLKFDTLAMGSMNDLAIKNLIQKLADIWGELISWLQKAQ